MLEDHVEPQTVRKSRAMNADISECPELISDFLPEEREVQRETAGNQLAL